MPELLRNAKVPNAFNTGGASILSTFGRTKSEAQARKDATRVNRFSDLARSTPDAGIRADQIRRGGR
jgi:hypothetical protein